MRALVIFYDGNTHRCRACETDQPDSTMPQNFQPVNGEGEVDDSGDSVKTLADLYPDCDAGNGVLAVITEGPRFDTTPTTVADPDFLTVFIDGGPIDPLLTEGDGTGIEGEEPESDTA